ncbi:radical SAM protein [Methanomicrobiaceae archaeon CYW5]|uniref:radical SAM protein n=1 Tax=Methanovulcanius yangii TaxID=1789227 RepID=UPI0029CA81B5|nr:radical SAM protein [Methanovulcanius yangii]MBT8508199.1 radical SAM protein [Methanovulcanius yangii]
MTSDAWIIDGYVDEPACFGVPPYIAPYIRYCAGVLSSHGYRVRYATIDQIRQDAALLQECDRADVVVMIAGVTVPGKYLGGTPASLTEIRQIGAALRHPLTALGGPVIFGSSAGGGEAAVRHAISGFRHILSGEVPAALDALLSGGEPEGTLSYADIDRWAVAGAPVITDHPSFPRVMCELETARGCSRAVTGGCSFCTEPFYGLPRRREMPGILAEVAALASAGAVHFRLGRQPDLLAYGATGGGEFPRPDPEALERLFEGVRTAAPLLRTLHIDNVNPGTIARHPEAARESLESIVRWHTPGDVAAFGMETADPAVVRANNLKALPDDVMEAIRIVNTVGSGRRNGVPELLPGLNFVCGLAGETEATYDMNEVFLRDVLAEGLMVRRVNIRQLMPFEGTAAWEDNTLGEHDARFRLFKERVRKEFDVPMLRRVFPEGTCLKDVMVEESGQTSFGRQMGSYPILVGIPMSLPSGTTLDAVVVSHGMRSVTGLPAPIAINALPPSALKWIPGVGKKRVASLMARRPFADMASFRQAIGTETPVDPYLTFGER